MANDCENTSFVQSETRTMVLHITVKSNTTAAFCKNKMEEEVPRFALREGTIDDFIDEQEKKHERKNRQRRKPAKPFLQRKVKLRNVEEIPPAQLNVLLSDFLFTARSKDGNDQVATSRPRK